MPTSTRSVRPNGHHTTHRSISTPEAECPYCGQPISRKEFDEIRARITAEEKARLAKLEQALAAKTKADIEKARRESAALVTKVKREATAREMAIRQEATAAATAALAPKITEAVNAERAKHFNEKLKLEAKLADVQARLQPQRTAHQIGEPAEVDLYEALKAAFTQDRVTRVPKGKNGADVIVDVMLSGTPIGKIIVDSKAHARWSNSFTRKLRADQLTEGADFAILSTSVFPKEARSSRLHIQDGVVACDPSCIITLMHLLRRQVVENHRLKLTAEARDDKADKLLAYIGSSACTDLFEEMTKLTSQMFELEQKDAGAYQATHKKRTTLIQSLQGAHHDLTTRIDEIVAGSLADVVS